MKTSSFCVLNLIILQCFLLNSSIAAQDSLTKKAEAYIGVDFATQYMWRGLVLTEGFVIQPSAEISLNQWSVGLWGSTSFVASENKELDVYVNYNFKNIKITVIDYFTYADSAAPAYFNYKKEQSAHIIETNVEFTGSDHFPFRFLAGVNLFGDSAYSTYLEAAWLTGLGETDIELVAGFTPQEGYYNESKKGFTNIGANLQRNIPLNEKLSMFLKFSVFYAPLVKQTYVALLIGLN